MKAPFKLKNGRRFAKGKDRPDKQGVLKKSGRPRSVKNRIRGLERLLKKEDLDPKVRKKKAEELEDLQRTFEQHKQAEKERKYALRYRRIKFFERVKVERQIKKLLRDQKEDDLDEVEKATMNDLKDKLMYITHFPKGEKYVSLLVNCPEDPLAQKTLDQERARLMALVKQQVKEMAALTEADEGRALDMIWGSEANMKGGKGGGDGGCASGSDHLQILGEQKGHFAEDDDDDSGSDKGNDADGDGGDSLVELVGGRRVGSSDGGGADVKKDNRGVGGKRSRDFRANDDDKDDPGHHQGKGREVKHTGAEEEVLPKAPPDGLNGFFADDFFLPDDGGDNDGVRVEARGPVANGRGAASLQHSGTDDDGEDDEEALGRGETEEEEEEEEEGGPCQSRHESEMVASPSGNEDSGGRFRLNKRDSTQLRGNREFADNRLDRGRAWGVPWGKSGIEGGQKQQLKGSTVRRGGGEAGWSPGGKGGVQPHGDDHGERGGLQGKTHKPGKGRGAASRPQAPGVPLRTRAEGGRKRRKKKK